MNLLIRMYEKNFKKGTDLYDYCVKIEEFFNQRFGKFVAQHIWEIYQKKLNIEIPKIKTVNEFMHLSNSIIEDVFSKHKKVKEVESIKLQLNMGFYISKVTKQLNEILKTKIKFKDTQIKTVSKRYVITYIEDIQEYSITNYNIKGMIEGNAFLIVKQINLKGYIEEFVKSMFETKEEQKEMIKDSLEILTKEFCDVLVGTFTDSIANTAKQTITPITDEENEYYNCESGKKKILNIANSNNYSRIMKGDLDFQYGIERTKLEVFFFFTNASEEFSDNMNKTKWQNEVKSTQKEKEVKRVENEYNEFIEKYLEGIDPVKLKEEFLKHLDIEFMTEMKYKHIKESIDYIEYNYLKETTPITKKFIINGLNNIFQKIVEINKKYIGV